MRALADSNLAEATVRAANDVYFYERKSCPICNSTEHSILYSGSMTSGPVKAFIQSHYQKQGSLDFSVLNGTDYTLLECERCMLIYQRMAPTPAMLDIIYNKMANPAFLLDMMNRSMTAESFEEIAGEFMVLMSRIGKQPAEVRVLDYGFGYGKWARVAVAMGAKVFATEISPEKIFYAKKIGVEIIDNEAIGNLRFDLVHTEQVFEHLTEPAQEFRRLASALAPGGIFKMAVPPLGKIKQLIASRGMINWSPQEQLWEGKRPSRKDKIFDDYICVMPLEHLNAFSSLSVEFLGRQSDLDIVGRVRKRAVPLHLDKPRLFVISVSNLAKELLRSGLRRNAGYFLFRSRKNALA